jgi:hypothetical protein
MNKLIIISLLCLVAVNCFNVTNETFYARDLDKSILEFSELSPRCNN